jgi:deoxyribonuclease-4
MARVTTAGAHRFGSHLSIAGGMHHAIEAALRLGMDAVQVFVKNQRQWRAAPLRSDDVERWHALLATPGFGPAVAHGTYLVNLAADDVELRERSCLALEEELRRCAELGIAYLVLHPGAAGTQPAPVALRNVARSLDTVLAGAPPAVMPLLETTAGQGSTLGRSFTELGEIIAGMRHGERVGVCIDTCHVFAAGYDIRTAEGYAAMIAEAQERVGLARIRCWHLNDSVGAFGSRRDRHAHVGRGQIGAAGFRNVLSDPRFRDLPMILETPKGQDDRGREWDTVNLRRLRAICRSPGARSLTPEP